MYVGPLMICLMPLICFIMLFVCTALEGSKLLASLMAVLSQGSGVRLPALDTAVGEAVLFKGVQGAERRVGWSDRTVFGDLRSAGCGRTRGADRRVATGCSQPKRLLVCAGNVDLLRPLLTPECEEAVKLRCLGAGMLRTVSVGAIVASGVPVANVGEPLASESSLGARSTGRSTSSSGVTAFATPATVVSAIVCVPTPSSSISVMPSAVCATLFSIWCAIAASYSACSLFQSSSFAQASLICSDNPVS